MGTRLWEWWHATKLISSFRGTDPTDASISVYLRLRLVLIQNSDIIQYSCPEDYCLVRSSGRLRFQPIERRSYGYRQLCHIKLSLIVHTAVWTEIVLNMISTVRRFCHFFRTSSDFQIGTFDDKIIRVESAGKFATIKTVAKCLLKESIMLSSWKQSLPLTYTNRCYRLTTILDPNLAAKTATNNHFQRAMSGAMMLKKGKGALRREIKRCLLWSWSGRTFARSTTAALEPLTE